MTLLNRRYIPAGEAKVGMTWHLSHGDMVIENIKPLNHAHGGAHVQIDGTVTKRDGTTYHETSHALHLVDYKMTVTAPNEGN